MMKKAIILSLLVLFSHQFIQAQIVGDGFNLSNHYPDPRGGSAYFSSNWTLDYLSNTELSLFKNGVEKMRFSSAQIETFVTLKPLAGIVSPTTIQSNTMLIADQKIGIRTNSPTEALTINNGLGRADGFIVYGSSATQSSWNAPWYGISKGDESQIDFVPNVSNSNPVLLQGFYGLAFRTNKGTMAMDDDGIVSIGLDASDMQGIAVNTDTWNDFKLYVADGIRTEKIKVDNKTAWPDYVFASSYDLKPLNEVETFIQENSHLPEVPSEADINENGIDLAQMDATLLKKIEELMLYTIAQQKQIELLTQQLKGLSTKNR